jgi:hypothetical protein
MPLYTFIMEYVGGSYVSQVKASSAKVACVKWAKALDVEKVVGLGQSSKLALVKEMREEIPVAIQNTLGVWCVTALLRGKLALITFVQTEKPED